MMGFVTVVARGGGDPILGDFKSGKLLKTGRTFKLQDYWSECEQD